MHHRNENMRNGPNAIRMLGVLKWDRKTIAAIVERAKFRRGWWLTLGGEKYG
jgi:hypothetical protein